VFALDPAGAQPVQPIGGFRNDTRFITCSPNGNWILGLADSKSVKRWDAHTNKRIGFLAAEEGAVLHTASYSPDERTLVTTAGNNTLQIRDAQELTLLRSWTAPGDIPINHAGYSPDGQTVIAAVADGSILLWSPKTDAIHRLVGHQGPVNSAAYSPDGLYIGSVSSDRTLRVWETGTERCVHTFHADGGLYSLAWHPDSAHVVVGGARGVYWLKWVR
jgi:WD40 repeat protein